MDHVGAILEQGLLRVESRELENVVKRLMVLVEGPHISQADVCAALAKFHQVPQLASLRIVDLVRQHFVGALLSCTIAPVQLPIRRSHLGCYSLVEHVRVQSRVVSMRFREHLMDA